MKDEQYMARALSLAAKARGRTSPNPMVGAVIVKNRKIIAEGYHRKAGRPHAEAIALEMAGLRARGATLYVSLEPCCHRDKRTPPCTDAIISSGIKRVVIAMTDPNPKVSGKGVEKLLQGGIVVTKGVLEEKAKRLNEAYIKYVTMKVPFVVLKIAMTLDGKIATPEGRSRWITGEESRRLVHKYRGEFDAVLSAIGTVKADDPQFTCRFGRGKSPRRIILDKGLDVDIDARILKTPPETILVAKQGRSRGKRDALLRKGVTIIEFKGARCDLQWLMSELGRREITSIMVEGGSSLNSSCLESKIVDKVLFFIAPKMIGGRESFPAVGGTTFRRLEDAYRLRDLSVKRLGQDIFVEGYLVPSPHR